MQYKCQTWAATKLKINFKKLSVSVHGKISHYVIFHRIFPLKWKAVLRRSKLFTVSPSEQLLIESNYFDATVIISEQLSLQSSYFFSRLTSSRQSFCRIAHFSKWATFSKELIFHNIIFHNYTSFFLQLHSLLPSSLLGEFGTSYVQG